MTSPPQPCIPDEVCWLAPRDADPMGQPASALTTTPAGGRRRGSRAAAELAGAAGGTLTRTEPDGRRHNGKRAGAALAETSVFRAVRCKDSVSAGFALDTG
jgi:hypothetical protein